MAAILCDTIDYTGVSCRKYLDIISGYDVVYQTKLDTERRKLCLRKIVCILKLHVVYFLVLFFAFQVSVIEQINKLQEIRSVKKQFRILLKIYGIVNSLVEDVSTY